MISRTANLGQKRKVWGSDVIELKEIVLPISYRDSHPLCTCLALVLRSREAPQRAASEVSHFSYVLAPVNPQSM